MDSETELEWQPEGADDSSCPSEVVPTTDTVPEESRLNLYKAIGVRNQAYWQCIRYVAPTAEKKKWTSADAVGVYCTECKQRIKYHAVKNNKGVKRHMEKCHMDLLGKFEVSFHFAGLHPCLNEVQDRHSRCTDQCFRHRKARCLPLQSERLK